MRRSDRGDAPGAARQMENSGAKESAQKTSACVSTHYTRHAYQHSGREGMHTSIDMHSCVHVHENMDLDMPRRICCV